MYPKLRKMRLRCKRKVSMTTFIKVRGEGAVPSLTFRKKMGWIEEIMENLEEEGKAGVKIIDRVEVILIKNQEVVIEAAMKANDHKREIVEVTAAVKTDHNIREIEEVTAAVKTDHNIWEIEEMTDHNIQAIAEEINSTRVVVGVTTKVNINHKTKVIVKFTTVEATEEFAAQTLQRPEVAIEKISRERVSIKIRITQQQIL